MTAIACYISGHGFGHAVRTGEVLRAVRRRRPDVELHLRTAVPRWFFDLGLGQPFVHAAVRLDVGAVQADSLTLDVDATRRAYAAIAAQHEALLAAEVTALAALRPRLVFADIPALAFDIAARLGVPGVAMTNFSWDWIYADYVRDVPAFASLVDELRQSYGRASLLLRLPFHGDLSAFPRIEDVPLVARRAGLAVEEVRRRLDLPGDQRVVLLSFGGIGIQLGAVPAARRGITYVATQSAADGGAVPPACRFLSNADLAARGVRYEDLVAAADVVITKPGYGIVADCIANGTAMIYTSRGRFAEYACLVRGIETHLPHAFLTNDDLRAGRWEAALDAVLGQARRAPSIRIDGADVVAERVLQFLS